MKTKIFIILFLSIIAAQISSAQTLHNSSLKHYLLPSPPVLNSPLNNIVNLVPGNFAIYWNRVTGATSRLQLSTSNTFNTIFYDRSDIKGTTSGKIFGFSYNTTYYWRVNATDSIGTSDWSEIWNFKIFEYAEPTTYFFILNAAAPNLPEPNYNAPYDSLGDPNKPTYTESAGSWRNSVSQSSYPYPISNGNLVSRVDTAYSGTSWASYAFTLPSDKSGIYALECAVPPFSTNASSNVTCEVTTPGVQGTQNGNFSEEMFNEGYWRLIGGKFRINGGGRTTVKFSSMQDTAILGWELLRTDLLRVRYISPNVVNFVLSGNISYNGSALSGVTVTLSGGKDSVLTTPSNVPYGFTQYGFIVTSGLNYTITPQKPGYSFNPANKYFFNVIANQSQNFTATVNIPDSVILSQPTDASTNIATNPVLSWNSSSVASSYRLQVSTSNTFAVTVFDQSGITGISQQITNLSNNTKYYWRVNATNSSGTSGWSLIWGFTTQGPVEYIPVSLPNTTATPNSSIEVPITVGDIAGKNVLSFQFTVTYNSGVLTAKDDIIVTGTMSGTTGWSVTPNTNTPGQITIGGFGSNSLSGSGTLLKLKFDVIGSQGTSSPLNFSGFIFNNGVPAATTTNGSITVIQPLICGDASDDGMVNAYDAAKALRHAIGLEVLSAQGQLNADVNKDGSITAFDAALILRHAIGLPMPNGVTNTCWGSQLSKTYSLIPAINIYMEKIKNENTGTSRIPIKINGITLNDNIYSISFDIEIDKNNTGSNISIDGMPPDYMAITNKINDNLFRVAVINANGISSKDIQLSLNVSGNSGNVNITKIILNDQSVPDITIMNGKDFEIPTRYDLIGSYPNPFNPSTKIVFQTPENSNVSIEIYNILGRKIKTLINGEISIGDHNIIWDGKDENNKTVSAGIYYCYMKAGSFTKMIKLNFVK